MASRHASGPGVVAVTGLQGFLGAGVVRRLLERSRAPRVVGIDHRRPFHMDPRIHFQRVDLCEPNAHEALAEILDRERVEAVLHAAFRSEPGPDPEFDHELDAIGSLQVMNACAQAKIQRLVVPSSTMLYGPRPDNPNFLSEEHPLRGHPDAHAVRDRIEVERLLGEWRGRHPEVEVCVLRHCWPIGPTYSSPAVKHFSLPIVPVPMGYDPLLQLVHEEDLLDAFEKALLERHPGVHHWVGRGTLPLSALLRLAGKRALPLPAPLLDRLAYTSSREQSGDPPAAFFDYLRYLWVADGERGWEVFGEPQYSTKEAWISFVSSRRMRRYR